MFKEKLKILEKLAVELEKKRENLVYELNNDPVSKLIELHLKFNDWLKDTKGEGRLSKESQNFIKNLIKEQEFQENRKKNYCSDKLTKKIVEIDFEIREINNEIYQYKIREFN